MKKGIDISKWQGTIDFSKVKNDGVEFTILRSSYRQSIDSRFNEYVRGCKEFNIPILGVYHFVYALNDDQALEEARFCVNKVEEAGLGKDVIIFVDFEYDTVEKAKKSGVNLGREECNRFTEIFCEHVESKGYKAGIYSNVDYYKNWYDKGLLSKYCFWLADYTNNPDYPCMIHQYTSSGRVDGIQGNVDMNYYYDMGEVRMDTKRQSVVDLIISWEGKNESDGSFKSIVDTYNSYKGKFPRGVKMEYSWAWCACTWSALAIKLGYTNIMPIEISCGYLIEAAKKMGCWNEEDSYIAKPGDAILYDWDDNGNGDNNAWPDHVGVIIESNIESGYYVVMEGNYNNAVKKRTISMNGRYIRGFITPKYSDNNLLVPVKKERKSIEIIAKEVIAGSWGSGEKRKKALESEGYNYKEVQAIVNKILNKESTSSNNSSVVATCYANSFDSTLAGTYTTTADLYCRNDAGTNKKALCCIPKGVKVENYGYYSKVNGVKWLYIQVTLDGVRYTGFSSSNYLKR